MAIICYPQSSGQVAVVFPFDNSFSIDQIASKVIPTGIGYKILDSLPSDFDNDFFNAYDFDETNGVVANIARAQEIQKNNWRELRSPLLSLLDVHFNMALERGDTSGQAIIAAQKQALRDVTKTVLPSDSIANIKATMPAILTQTYSYTPPTNS
jgi:hypothetical protein